MFKKRFIPLLLITLTTTFNACKKDTPGEYAGTNIIYLESGKSNVLTIGESGSIEVTLKSTIAAKEDTKFQFDIKPLEGANAAWVKVKEADVILKKGEKTAVFHIVTTSGVSPDIDFCDYELTIGKLPLEKMELKQPLRFQMVYVNVPVLTDVQKKFIDGYKSKGMDISPFLGKVSVKTKAAIPADGSIDGFNAPAAKEYTGFSIITLSEKATAEKPILKMVYNPMGATDFFYFAMKKHTIENKEFWYADKEIVSPYFPTIMKLLKWNDTSVERFGAELDGITVGTKQGDECPIEYIEEVKDFFGDFIKIVPFKFSYTAWDRHLKLVKEGNEDAITIANAEGTANPDLYLNNKDISKKPRTGKLFLKEKKMSFSFPIIVTYGGGDIIIEAEYTAQ